MTIGEKIRFFRLEKGLSQEKLSERLNISFQSVSRWERDEALPDVNMICRLADILNVSCDAILRDADHFAPIDIQSIIADSQRFDEANSSEYREKIDLLEKSLEKYPYSVELMAALADAYCKGEQYPEYKENNYALRAIHLYEYIAEHSPTAAMRYQAIQILCYMYRSQGEYSRVRELAEGMPELYQTRPALIYHSLEGDKIYSGIYDYIIKLLDSAQAMMNVSEGSDDRSKEHFEWLKKEAQLRFLDKKP